MWSVPCSLVLQAAFVYHYKVKTSTKGIFCLCLSIEFLSFSTDAKYFKCKSEARPLKIGGCIFIYSDSALLISFGIRLISKEISGAEHEYMNIYSPIYNTLSLSPCNQMCILKCVNMGKRG